MRELLPSTGTHEVDLHAHYAAGWLPDGGLRMNFVSSVDGAAHAGGLSKALQTSGDNRVFAALRDLADVVLVGAGTARAEGYRASRPTGVRLAARQAWGLADTLPIAVVSNSLDLDVASPLFTQTDPDARTIVLTTATADPARRAALGAVADVVSCGDHVVDPVLLRTALTERGLTRILGEGGPTLFGTLAGAGVVDELCLSISPLLSGPGAGRVITGMGWTGPRAMQLAGLLEEDGALFCRYRVAPAA